MNMRFDARYQALCSRDVRFDGQFFTAVHTTGIYCRPICPAKTPKKEHISFYSCASAAESAGFRPCKRCRPETAPGTPVWLGTSATVSRAMRMIEDGFLEEGSVDDLAARLGIGARHLRRLFRKHLGTNPHAVHLTRRVHLAYQLLRCSDQPVSTIAFASGFNSLRRFNNAFRKSFRQSPTDLRRALRQSKRPSNDQPLRLILAYRPPFDWQHITAFLKPRLIPGVESLQDQNYTRSVRFDDRMGVISVQPVRDRHQLALTIPSSLLKDVPRIVVGVRRLFDLDCEPATIQEALSRDEALQPLLARFPGIRVPGIWCPFEGVMRAILGQQISVTAATKLVGVLVQEVGEQLDQPNPSVTHCFPTPDKVARDLTNMPMPRGRFETVKRVAEAVSNGQLDVTPTTHWAHLADRLQALKGIGPWTSDYVLMRAFSDPDAFPHRDLGLIHACRRMFGAKMTWSDMLARAESWRPWRAYVTMLLWKSLHQEQ